MEIEAEAVLFDLDGVLANSNATVEDAWRTWAVEKNIDADEIVRFSHGRRTTETLERFLPGQPHAPEIARLTAMEHAGIDRVIEVPGARQFVKSLSGVPWGVATSGETAIAVARLNKVGIPVPLVLITAEQVRRGKPDPEVYLTAAQSLGVEPDRTVIFEDAPSGIASGHAAGARVIGLLTTFPPHALHDADALVQDFTDVRAERTLYGVRLYVRGRRPEG